MSPAKLEDWLATEQSQEVGWKREGESEAVGHQSGRKVAESTDDDYAHMRKVGYVHRHCAQRPPGDARDTRWRYSLLSGGTIR